MTDNEKENKRDLRLDQIERISARFNEIWKRYPNLKFNQLAYYINCVSSSLDTDFYFITDDEFESFMEQATQSGGDLAEIRKQTT